MREAEIMFSTCRSKIAEQKFIAANVAEYGPLIDANRWVDSDGISTAEAKRARLLNEAARFLQVSAKQTKPHLGDLSPGCRICTEGQWSCLFINGKCNCRCFYCPTDQNDISVPTTNRVPFATAQDYAEYVQRLGFRGVSISGGEPLMTFKRTLAYIQAVRQTIGPHLHIWMYTNGTLVTADHLHELKAAGLNEIRFDISAVDYDLAKPELAAGIIDCVTVEIPAIPEDAERLKNLLPQMAAVGIRHLNLHQLRLTPFNAHNLVQRPYTFLHGESVTVLESELTALDILQTAGNLEVPLAINYCSFVYKRRYQQAAARRRNGGDMHKGWESVTESGFIRTLALKGDPGTLKPEIRKLMAKDPTQHLWSVNSKGDRLLFHPSFWPDIDVRCGSLTITYSENVLVPSISYHHTFKEVRLPSGKKLYIEKRPLFLELPLSEGDRVFFEHYIIAQSTTPSAPYPTVSADLLRFEFIVPGLQDYF